MSCLRLHAVEKKCTQGAVRLVGHSTRPDGRDLTLHYAYPEEYEALVSDGADPFVPPLLLAAMAENGALEIEPPVSRRLFAQLATIQEILADWFPERLRAVPVRAPTRVGARGTTGGGTGAFCSLGVDSLHTLFRHEAEAPGREHITHLIFMTGFESRLRDAADGRSEAVRESVRALAARLGKRAICGETNLRDVLDVKWGPHLHGAGLGGTALSLSAGLGRVLIPSSFAWRHVMPWASSPIVDPLWSSDDQTILHDGTGDDRARKIVDVVLKQPGALRLLRVCPRSSGGAGNCGACNKCVRTMTTLEIAGALRECGVFPPRLPRAFWRYLKIKGSGVPFEDDNLRLARALNAEPWIVEGLERAVRLGRLEAIRQRDGTGSFLRGLAEFAWERSAGVLLHRLRTGRKRPKPRAR